MRPFVLAAAVIALLSFAGCGGEDATSDTSAGTGGGGDAQTLAVAASDFMFAPADLQAEPGALTIELTNDGQSPHAIEITGNGVDESSEEINGGDSASFTLELEEGTYEVYCPVGNHKAMGMVGTLTVGSGGAGAGGGSTGDTGSSTDDGSGTGTGSDDDSPY